MLREAMGLIVVPPRICHGSVDAPLIALADKEPERRMKRLRPVWLNL